MLIEINYRDGHSSSALDERVRGEIQRSIGHLADRVTRIEVHLGDENASKSGPADKRCLLEARPAGLDPIAVETHASDFYDAVQDAAGKLKRALTTRFEKLDR